MAATEIDKTHFGQEFGEMGLDRCHGALQGIRVLLTEIVPVQAADPIQRIGRKIPPPDAEPGAGRAGIVERNRPFRMLRIDTQAKGQPAAVLRGPLPGPRQQAPFLGQGVCVKKLEKRLKKRQLTFRN